MAFPVFQGRNCAIRCGVLWLRWYPRVSFCRAAAIRQKRRSRAGDWQDRAADRNCSRTKLAAEPLSERVKISRLTRDHLLQNFAGLARSQRFPMGRVRGRISILPFSIGKTGAAQSDAPVDIWPYICSTQLPQKLPICRRAASRVRHGTRGAVPFSFGLRQAEPVRNQPTQEGEIPCQTF